MRVNGQSYVLPIGAHFESEHRLRNQIAGSRANHSRANYSFGVGTHRYRKPGIYTVSLTVEDGRGGIDTTTGTVTIVSRQVLFGDVLFDFNRATLKKEGMKELDKIVTILKEMWSLRSDLEDIRPVR